VEFEVDGVTVYTGEGNEMKYYFFNYKSYVVWISSTDSEAVEKYVINELLDYL